MLKTPAAKLFFILFYLKTYSTFDVLGFLSGKSRNRSWEAANLYLLLLEQTLSKKIKLPERKINSVEKFLEKFPEVKDIIVDGTERRIQRPQKTKHNRRTYSGKNKGYTRKNLIVVDEHKRILIVSPTKPGRHHDKNLTDRIHLAETVPDQIGIWGDSVFQGLHHKHPYVLAAKRAHKNRPFTLFEKREHHIISSIRVVAEHAIGGMKRYQVMTNTLRNKIASSMTGLQSDCRYLELPSGLQMNWGTRVV